MKRNSELGNNKSTPDRVTEKYSLYTDCEKGSWSLKGSDGSKMFIGLCNPYDDLVYAATLCHALGTEASEELKGILADLGFTGTPLLLRANESGCTLLKGEQK